MSTQPDSIQTQASDSDAVSQALASTAPNKANPFLILFLVFPILGIVAALATAGSRNAASSTMEPPAVAYQPVTLVNNPAPDFTLETLASSKVQLSSLRGQWVFLNFWATWCPPCKQEMPTFQKLLDGGFGDFKGKVTVLAVNRVEAPDVVKAYLEQNKLQLPVVLDPELKANTDYNVLQLPVTYIIDPQGVVRYQQFGELTPDLLKRYLADMKLTAGSSGG